MCGQNAHSLGLDIVRAVTWSPVLDNEHNSLDLPASHLPTYPPMPSYLYLLPPEMEKKSSDASGAAGANFSHVNFWFYLCV